MPQLPYHVFPCFEFAGISKMITRLRVSTPLSNISCRSRAFWPGSYRTCDVLEEIKQRNQKWSLLWLNCAHVFKFNNGSWTCLERVTARTNCLTFQRSRSSGTRLSPCLDPSRLSCCERCGRAREEGKGSRDPSRARPQFLVLLARPLHLLLNRSAWGGGRLSPLLRCLSKGRSFTADRLKRCLRARDKNYLLSCCQQKIFC